MYFVAADIYRNSFRFCSTLSSNVRVRFAPSPTGSLHLGGLRTAFYNFLYAKKNNGKFILRIEDTDQKRVKAGSVQNLNAMLKWCGLHPDESSEVGGPFSPYVQSERLAIYREKVNVLLKMGFAYRCFCSETRLTVLKKEAQANRVNHGYDNKCRHLTSSEEQGLLNKGLPYTVRFKVPERPVTHTDIVYGENTYNLSVNEGDFIILKSDGFPTYHFSCVVDDHLMEISHVLRGTEWLISTPKHILMYEAFGWTPPKYAHLPLLVNSDRTKLSKRQESIGVEYFKNKGYFPDALLSFLAAAGGGFGKQEGCFACDLETLSSKFQLENMNTGSCIVDFRKLDLFNHDYIVKQLSNENTANALLQKLRCILKEKYGERYEREENNLPDSYMMKILLGYKDRLNNLQEFVEGDMAYLWTASDIKSILKIVGELKVSDSVVDGWKSIAALLESLPDPDFTQDSLTEKLKETACIGRIPYVHLMRSLRVLLTGQKDGPGVSEILVMLGKSRSINKINAVLDEVTENVVRC